jgi:hypothetical protein
LKHFPDTALFVEKPIATGPKGDIEEALKVSQAIVNMPKSLPLGNCKLIIFWLCKRIVCSLSLSFTLVVRAILFLPCCITVGAAITLYPRALSPLIRMYAGPPHIQSTDVQHAHTVCAHLQLAPSCRPALCSRRTHCGHPH